MATLTLSKSTTTAIKAAVKANPEASNAQIAMLVTEKHGIEDLTADDVASVTGKVDETTADTPESGMPAGDGFEDSAPGDHRVPTVTGNQTPEDDDESDESDDGDEAPNQPTSDVWRVTLPESDPMYDVVLPLVSKRNALKASMGGKDRQLQDLKQEIADLENAIREKREQANAITPIVNDTQIRISQIEDSIHRFQSPITLQSRRGVGRPAGGARSGGGLKDDFIAKGLELARAMPATFGISDIMTAKGCESNTAGGWAKKYVDGGVYERISNGVFKVADEYKTHKAFIG